jgi:hypothetical protein
MGRIVDFSWDWGNRRRLLQRNPFPAGNTNGVFENPRGQKVFASAEFWKSSFQFSVLQETEAACRRRLQQPRSSDHELSPFCYHGGGGLKNGKGYDAGRRRRGKILGMG